MKLPRKNLLAVALAAIWLVPTLALAHQPRIVADDIVHVKNPEISQAFYGELNGRPTTYEISSDRDFRLYVGLLVPAVPEMKTDFVVEIFRMVEGRPQQISRLDGSQFQWRPFHEEYGNSDYYWGPEFKANDSNEQKLVGWPEPAGDYRLVVSSPWNRGKYSLAVGDVENFPPTEIIKALVRVPQLKRVFFGEPVTKVLFSPIGLGNLALLYIAALVAALAIRFAPKRKEATTEASTSAGPIEIILAPAIALILLVWQVWTSWNPLIIFLSGLVAFWPLYGRRLRDTIKALWPR